MPRGSAVVARAKVRFAASDIWDAPDDDKRYEAIDGRLYVTPSPSPRHQRAVGMLYGHLWQQLRAHAGGELVPAPLGVVLDDETAVQPDLVYVSSQKGAIIGERGLEGAPDLVVEVLSPSTRSRDRGIKMKRYAVAGIPHYWIVDLTSKR